MNSRLRIWLMPLLGLAVIGMGLYLNKTELRLRLTGTAAHATVAGMQMRSPDGYDFINVIEIAVTFTRADGNEFTARQRNGEWLTPSPEDPVFREWLLDAFAGSADVLRWMLLRESRRGNDPLRIVRIAKVESATGYFNLPKAPEAFEVANDRIVPMFSNGEVPADTGTVVTVAVFEVNGDAPQFGSARQDSMVTYERQLEGEPYPPFSRDFILSAEPYATEFRPVFSYRPNTAGDSLARISHIGRRGGPTLALRLFGGGVAYFDGQRPEVALLIADTERQGESWLSYFSRYSEGVFAQWGNFALILLSGLLFMLAGVFLVSLLVVPSRHLDS